MFSDVNEGPQGDGGCFVTAMDDSCRTVDKESLLRRIHRHGAYPTVAMETDRSGQAALFTVSLLLSSLRHEVLGNCHLHRAANAAPQWHT